MRKLLMTLILAGSVLYAGERVFTLRFNPADLKLGSEKGYTTVIYRDMGYVNPWGAPMLPSQGVRVLIPADAVVKKVEVVNLQTSIIGTGYKVMPQQKPVPISYKVNQPFIEPDEKYYKLDIYPQNIVKFTGDGYMDGFHLVNLLVYPVIYEPISGTLKLVNSISFKVIYEEGKRRPKAVHPNVYRIAKENIKTLILNPQDVELFAPPLRN